MRKIFTLLTAVVLGLCSANAYNFTVVDSDGHATISNGTTSITSTDGNTISTTNSYLTVSPESGYAITSVQTNGGSFSIYYPLSSNYASSSGAWSDSAGSYVGAWSESEMNTITVTTCSVDELRTDSFVVEADNYNNFYLHRNSDNTDLYLTAETSTVPYSSSLDSSFLIYPATGQTLYSVKDGNNKTLDVSSWNGTASFYPNSINGKISIQTELPDVDYTVSISCGEYGLDCFSSVKVNGEEVTELASTYKAGTKIELTPNTAAYDFEYYPLTINGTQSSKYYQYNAPWTITITEDTSITVAATKTEVYTVTVNLYGANGVSLYSYADYNTYYPQVGTPMALLIKQSANSKYFYINNIDSDKYTITKYVYNDTEYTSPSQSTYSNMVTVEGDGTLDIYVDEVKLTGNVHFSFDDTSVITLYDKSGNTIEISDEMDYAVKEDTSSTTYFRMSAYPYDNFKVYVNGTAQSISYGTAYLYLKNGDNVVVKTKASDVKYSLNVSVEGVDNGADIFNYIMMGNTYPSYDSINGEYAEDTQFDFNIKSDYTINSVTVNNESVSPVYGTTYRISLTEDTNVVFNVSAPEEWTFTINVDYAASITVLEGSNGYSQATLHDGDNTFSCVKNNQFVIQWNYQESDYISSIKLDGGDELKPTNQYQNNITVTVSADNQVLRIVNSKPVSRDDKLTISTTVSSEYDGVIKVTNKDGEELGDIRYRGTAVTEEVAFSLADDAPLTVWFYDEFEPQEFVLNNVAVKGETWENVTTVDYSGEDIEDGSETSNQTAETCYKYVLKADALVSGNNTLDLNMANVNGLNNIYVNAAALNGVVYNLQGIAVGNASNINNLPAGIYIVNGRKIAKK
jgi:hypothetical protein